MRMFFYQLSLLFFIFNFDTTVLATEEPFTESPHSSDMRKYGESLKYSPFLVNTYQPKQLIQNWSKLNSLYTTKNSGVSKEFGEDLILKQQQLERLLENIDTYIRSRGMSESMAFNFEYVTFAEVCLSGKRTPEKIACLYRVRPEILQFYLEHNKH